MPDAQRRRRREEAKRARRLFFDSIDAGHARWDDDWDDLAENVSSSTSTKARWEGDIDALCDALFSGEEDLHREEDVFSPTACTALPETSTATAVLDRPKATVENRRVQERPMPVVSPRPNANYAPTRAGSSRMGRRLLTAACLLLSAVFLFTALPSAWFSPEADLGADATPVAAVDQQPRYVRSNIEDLVEGDTILAMNPRTGQLEEKRIIDAFQRTTYHLRILEFQGPDGAVQRLETTDEHPFWAVSEEDFVPAGELQVGDQFLGPRGELQTLSGTHREEQPEGVPVYNFEVEGAHTYFVTAHGLRAPPVLVHNASGGECGLTEALKRFPRAKAIDIRTLRVIKGSGAYIG